MMGKTHLAIGVAASLLLTQPQTPSECIAALIGGAAGGILADIDILDNKTHDSLKMQFTCMGLIFLLLMVDSFFHLGICDAIFNSGSRLPLIGGGAFALLWIVGVFTAHRTFTHSITAAALYSACIWLIYPPMMSSFAAGYISHLALDLLNRKKMPLLFPIRFGICLRLCYADSFANKIFFRVGTAVSAAYVLLLGLRPLFAAL